MTLYLDNAASSHPKPETVYQTVNEVLKNIGANPGRAGHGLAVKAGQWIFRTRQALAELFDIKDPNRIVFTANATEALNLGLKGLLNPGDHVITSSMEHNSVIRPLRLSGNPGGGDNHRFRQCPWTDPGPGHRKSHPEKYPAHCFDPCLQCNRGLDARERSGRINPQAGDLIYGGCGPDRRSGSYLGGQDGHRPPGGPGPQGTDGASGHRLLIYRTGNFLTSFNRGGNGQSIGIGNSARFFARPDGIGHLEYPWTGRVGGRSPIYFRAGPGPNHGKKKCFWPNCCGKV